MAREYNYCSEVSEEFISLNTLMNGICSNTRTSEVCYLWCAMKGGAKKEEGGGKGWWIRITHIWQKHNLIDSNTGIICSYESAIEIQFWAVSWLCPRHNHFFFHSLSSPLLCKHFRKMLRNGDLCQHLASFIFYLATNIRGSKRWYLMYCESSWCGINELYIARIAYETSSITLWI